MIEIPTLLLVWLALGLLVSVVLGMMGKES